MSLGLVVALSYPVGRGASTLNQGFARGEKAMAGDFAEQDTVRRRVGVSARYLDAHTQLHNHTIRTKVERRHIEQLIGAGNYSSIRWY